MYNKIYELIFKDFSKGLLISPEPFAFIPGLLEPEFEPFEPFEPVDAVLMLLLLGDTPTPPKCLKELSLLLLLPVLELSLLELELESLPSVTVLLLELPAEEDEEVRVTGPVTTKITLSGVNCKSLIL